MDPIEHKQLQELRMHWPKSWPPLSELQKQNPEILILLLAGRFFQLEKDLMAVAKAAAQSDPQTGKALQRYFKRRDKALEDVVAK